MTKKEKKRIILKCYFKMMKVLILGIAFSSLAFAGGEETGGFMNLASSVRSVGMGGAYVGIGEGIESLNYNSAGLAGLTRREALLGYTKHFADIPLSSIAYGQPILKGAFAIKVFLMNTDGGEEANMNGRTGKKVDVSCRLISLSYATEFAQNVKIGGNVNLIDQNYAGYKGNTFSLDLGILGKFDPMSLGLSLNNLGSDVEIDNVKNSLPFNIKAGLGYKIRENILIGCDVEKPEGSSLVFHVGTEYNLLPDIDLRGGYSSISGYSLGFGIRSYGAGVMKNILAQIDYAYLYHPSLDSSHRVSLLTKF